MQRRLAVEHLPRRRRGGRHRRRDRLRRPLRARCSRRPSGSASTCSTLLLTHHHHDHVAEAGVWQRRWRCSPTRSRRRSSSDVDRTIEPGEHARGRRAARRDAAHARATPPGCSTSWSTASDVFTGDTLFKGSVGGVRAPGSTSFADLRHSIMDVLMELPHETRVQPGHTDPTTIGDEWESNAVRPALARPRRGGRRALQGLGARRPRSCSVGARLRRRAQGLGALAGRQRRHRPGQPGRRATDRGARLRRAGGRRPVRARRRARARPQRRGRARSTS